MITIIEGPKKSGKSALANAMRDRQISRGFDEKAQAFHGALLIDEKAQDDAEPRHLLEKLIHGMALPADGTPVNAKDVPWKADPQVIIVGDATKWLKTFEKLVPGFKAKVGPVKKMKLADA